MKTKILADFQIFISVPLKLTQQRVCDYTRNKRIFVASCVRKKERSAIAS